MVRLSFTVDDEVADDIRSCAEDEGQSVSDFLGTLVEDALAEFYGDESESEGE